MFLSPGGSEPKVTHGWIPLVLIFVMMGHSIGYVCGDVIPEVFRTTSFEFVTIVLYFFFRLYKQFVVLKIQNNKNSYFSG